MADNTKLEQIKFKVESGQSNISDILLKNQNNNNITQYIELKRLEAENEGHSLEEIIRLAVEGHARYQFQLGKLFRDGRGIVEINKEKCLYWFKLSSNNDYLPATFDLGKEYWKNEEWKLALECFEDLSKKTKNREYTYCINGYMGDAYFYGNYYKQDINKAAECFCLSILDENDEKSYTFTYIANLVYNNENNAKQLLKSMYIWFKKTIENEKDEDWKKYISKMLKLLEECVKETLDGKRKDENYNEHKKTKSLLGKFNKKSKWLTCIHEAGHAITQAYFFTTKSTTTIKATATDGGYCELDVKLMSSQLCSYEDECNWIMCILAGGAAEKLFNCNSVGTTPDYVSAMNFISRLILQYGYGKKFKYPIIIADPGSDRWEWRDNFYNELRKLPEPIQIDIFNQINEEFISLQERTNKFLAKHKSQIKQLALLIMKNNDTLEKQQVVDFMRKNKIGNEG